MPIKSKAQRRKFPVFSAWSSASSRPQIRSVAELNLPPSVERLATERRGLILVTGTTGSGKSTTLAAMIDHINRTRQSHIITIEDPIEYDAPRPS